MSVKRKVLYIHHGGGLGGAPLSLLYLLRRLDRTRYEPAVLCLHDGTAADLYRREGIPTFVDERIVDFSHTTLVWYSLTSPREVAARSVRFFSSMATTRRFLREHSPDLVHLNSSTLASCAIAAKREGIPVVWHIREPLSRGHLSLRQTLLRRAIHRYADRVVAIGNHEADQLIRDDRVRVIYNFVDFTLFDRALSGENFREEMGARSETRLVGMLGGVSRVKGTKEFVEALPFVRRALPEVKFIVLGGLPDPRARRRPWGQSVGTYFGEIQHFISNQGLADAVHFGGTRQDIPQIIAGLDMVVFPSTVPHSARPLIEAGAMGKPVVASDLGGPRELVIHGETGLLVRPRDPQALAKAIVDILSNVDAARRMGECGSVRARAMFDAETNAAKTLAIYDEIL